MSVAAIAEVLEPLFALSDEEPEPGLTLWSFYTRQSRAPLDLDDVAARISSGTGVLALELVLDADLEPVQRQATRIKSCAELRALVHARARVVGVPSAAAICAIGGGPRLPAGQATLGAGPTARRGPLHGALMMVPAGDVRAR